VIGEEVRGRRHLLVRRGSGRLRLQWHHRLRCFHRTLLWRINLRRIWAATSAEAALLVASTARTTFTSVRGPAAADEVRLPEEGWGPFVAGADVEEKETLEEWADPRVGGRLERPADLTDPLRSAAAV